MRIDVINTMRFLTVCVIILLSCILQVSGQTVHKNLMQGDQMYADSLYSLAEEHYRKAEQEGSNFKSIYNLGNALYKQERYEEASEQFNRAVSNATTKEDKALAMHNLANAYLNNQELQDAILFYKEAIKLNPNHKETKYNLMVAKEILKQAQQQEQDKQCDNPQQSDEQSEEEKEKQEQQENQEQQDQESQEDKDKQEEDSDEGSEDEQEQEDEEDSEEEEGEEGESAAMDSSRLEKQSLDSLDAMKLLQIIQDEESKVQEKLRKFSTDRRKSDKDW